MNKLTKTVLLLALALFAAQGCGKKSDPSQAADADTGVEDSAYQDDSLSDGSTGFGDGQDQSTTTTLSSSDLQSVYFPFNQASLDEQARRVLQQNYALLRDSNQDLIVEGHCDERGTDEYNLALGERRALTIKNYLTSLGISPSRISTISYGEEKPAAIGTGESIWSQNRRGEFVINR